VGTFARSYARPLGERHVILAGYQRSIRQICRSPYIEPATSLTIVGMTGIASVLIQKFESLQIRVAVADLFWAARGISDGSEDGGAGSQ